MAEVLAQLPDGQLSFSSSPLRRSSASQTSFFLDPKTSSYTARRTSNYSQSDLRSESLSSSAPSSSRASSTTLSQSSSFQSTPTSSLSLETKFTDDDVDDDDDDDGIIFPNYDGGRYYVDRSGECAPPSSPKTDNALSTPSPINDVVSPTTASSPDLLLISEDDSAIRREPSQHVDYLSHEWEEEDIWSSWRHIVSQRKVFGERSRLENASWRTWAKAKFKLQTVSPETLNWLKDCDVTWLYGPLQTASNRTLSQHASEPVSRLSKNNSFLHKKPILKKRSMSEVMLQKSISASSLVKQAAAAVQAQQASSLHRIRDRPILGRAASDFVTSSIPTRTTSRDTTDYSSSQSTSGLQTPEHGERRHIRFDDKVEQCIAVDLKDGEYDDDDENGNWPMNDDDDDSSDDGIIMMKKSRRKKPLSRSNSRSSFNGESKTIAKLPSTTLKYRTDSPDIPDQASAHSLGFWRSSRLSPSPSQETLRPSNPAANFLLPEDDDEDENPWEPSDAFQATRDAHSNQEEAFSSKSDDQQEWSGGLRRTASGMFMPYDEDEDEPAAPGIIGRVVDTVNTMRDIGHVIWNVGWRK